MATVKKTPVKASNLAPANASVKSPAGTNTPLKSSMKKARPAKPASKTVKPVKTVKPTDKVKTLKTEKSKKAKLVRDSFTIPKTEYLVLEALKQRAAKLTRPVKKSELLRAGIKVIAGLSDTAFLAALDQVPAIKTGRPLKS